MNLHNPAAGIMKPLQRIIRLIYVSGFVILVAAAIRTFLGAGPDWFGEAVYTSCAFVAVSLIVFWLASELALRFSTRRGVHFLVLAIALAAVITPVLYISRAAFFGQGSAEFDTWHLLPLFTLMHQVKIVVIVGAIGGCLMAIIAITRHLAHRIPNKALNHDAPKGGARFS